MYYIRGESPGDDRDRLGTPQCAQPGTIRWYRVHCGLTARWWSLLLPVRTLSAGCGGGEGWLGAVRRSPLWITLVVVMATVGAFAAVKSQEPHPEASFALVDIDAYQRLTGISACASPLVSKP